MLKLRSFPIHDDVPVERWVQARLNERRTSSPRERAIIEKEWRDILTPNREI
jgi:hypothetical protein